MAITRYIGIKITSESSNNKGHIEVKGYLEGTPLYAAGKRVQISMDQDSYSLTHEEFSKLMEVCSEILTRLDNDKMVKIL